MSQIKLSEGTVVKDSDGVNREIVYRKTAIKEGLTRFFTGKPCKYGHIAERKVKSYICIKCAREKQKRYHKLKMNSDADYRDRFLKNRLKRHHERYRAEPEYRQKFIDRAKTYREKMKENN